MILLPRDMLFHHFDGQLKRGCFLRYRATVELDDPDRTERFKYALVLSLDCSGENVYVAFTTSRLEYFQKNIQFQYLLLKWEPGRYAWITVTTILNLKQILLVSRADLRTAVLNGDLTFEGEISPVDQTAVDEILHRSPLISPQVRGLILR